MYRLIAVGLLLTSCGGSHVDSGPMRPEPAEPPSGDLVRTLAIDETTFSLYAQGECVAVEVVTPGLLTDVRSWCPGQDYPITATESCAWSAVPQSGDEIACEARIPTVLFGRVTSPNIGWVCIATRPADSLTTGVRFLEHDDHGFILEPQYLDESQYAHLFTFNGARYGEPPLDAPSTDMYAACEKAAPWDDLGIHYDATLRVTISEQLRRDDVVVIADGGLGESGVSGVAGEDGVIDHYVRIAANSRGLNLRVLSPEPNEVLAHLYPWPEDLQQIVDSDRQCVELIDVDVSVGVGALEGDSDAVEISMRGRPCSSILDQ